MTILDLDTLSHVTGGTAMPKGPAPDLSKVQSSWSGGDSSTWKPSPAGDGSTARSAWGAGGGAASPWSGSPSWS